MPTPILFVTDAPERTTGLARIGRDLAVRLHHANPYMRVGFLGIGGTGCGGFGGQQYFCDGYEFNNPRTGKAMGDVLPRVWNDFSGGEPGIIFTIGEPSWMLWFSCPEYVRKVGCESLATFLENPSIQKWCYAVIDGEGPNGKLSEVYKEVLKGYHRVVAPSQWAQELIDRTVGAPTSDYLPHGLDGDIFHNVPDKEICRMELGVPTNSFLIGTVMTNQPRKDWALAAAITSDLRNYISELRLWWHTDVMERTPGWSIPAIAKDFGIEDILHVTIGGTDSDMCRRYNACDLTILPSSGEGVGYPLIESNMCGTPALHINYAGGAEYTSWKVRPQIFRYEGQFNTVRPVTHSNQWSTAIMEGPKETNLDYLEWKNLWPRWQRWFESGVATLQDSISSFSAT